MIQPPWETYSDDAARELFRDADAIAMLNALAEWSHLYDDLIDAPDRVAPAAVHRAMWLMAHVIPTNPFFRRHEALLRPVLVTGLLAWHAANAMEASRDIEQLRVAHTLRYDVASVALLVLEIVGGHEHAVANAARARLLFQRDTWANYLSEHT